MTYGPGFGPDPRWDEANEWQQRGETDPWLLGQGDSYGRDPYEAAGVPEPMVPGLQPWQTGEPEGELVEDDWRRRYLEKEVEVDCCGHGVPVNQVCAACYDQAGVDPWQPAEPMRCGPCGGAGCGYCGFSGWVR